MCTLFSFNGYLPVTFLPFFVFAMLLKSSLHNLQFCTHHGCLPIILIIILSGSIVCTLLFTNRSELYLHCLHNNSGFCGNLVDPRFSPGILVSFSEEFSLDLTLKAYFDSSALNFNCKELLYAEITLRIPLPFLKK